MGVIARCVRVSKHVPMGRKCVREREREREHLEKFQYSLPSTENEPHLYPGQKMIVRLQPLDRRRRVHHHLHQVDKVLQLVQESQSVLGMLMHDTK